MSSKLGLSLAAALVLSAATTGVARAESPLNASESGNPNSVDYPNRHIAKHSATKGEFDADEIGSPYNVDYRNRPVVSDRNWKSDWDRLDSGTPASVEPRDGTAPKGQAAAAAPSAH